MNVIKSLIILSCFSIVSMGGVKPSHAESIFDILFGTTRAEENLPDPRKTAQAPFIDPKKNQVKQSRYFSEGQSKETNTLQLDQPHRSPEVIADWAAGIVAESLTFNGDSFPAVEKAIRPYYSTYGLEEYKTYIEKTGLLDSLRQSHMRVASISEGRAQVIREGVVSGTYHWLVQVPIMVTFYDKDMKSLDDTKKKKIQNRKILIQVQAGRARVETTQDMGLEIERWVATSAP